MTLYNNKYYSVYLIDTDEDGNNYRVEHNENGRTEYLAAVLPAAIQAAIGFNAALVQLDEEAKPALKAVEPTASQEKK